MKERNNFLEFVKEVRKKLAESIPIGETAELPSLSR